MRYTTIIDISEVPGIYRNSNCRLVYLHLACKSGYHDNDRDLIDISIRRLAWEVGLSVSATRHALTLLEKAQLLTRTGGMWTVKKWILEQPITQRPRTQKQQKAQDAETTRRAENKAREDKLEAERAQREAWEAAGKNSFIIYYEDLMKRAKEGDAEAIQLVEKRRGMYEQELAKMKRSRK